MIEQFWKSVLAQNVEEIRRYFREDAFINWHCTNERFTVDEFIRANCEYPGEWAGNVERTIRTGDTIITVVHVYPKDCSASFHVVSFFHLDLETNQILSLNEYWADDGVPPSWRREMCIGHPIR